MTVTGVAPIVLPEWVQIFLIVGAILSALTAVIVFFRKMWPALTTFVTNVNALSDLPQFMVTTAHALADQDTTLAGQGAQIADINHQIHENGGLTLKDGVVDIRKQMTANTRRLQRIETGVKGLYGRMDDAEKELEQTRPRPPKPITPLARTPKKE